MRSEPHSAPFLKYTILLWHQVNNDDFRVRFSSELAASTSPKLRAYSTTASLEAEAYSEEWNVVSSRILYRFDLSF